MVAIYLLFVKIFSPFFDKNSGYAGYHGYCFLILYFIILVTLAVVKEDLNSYKTKRIIDFEHLLL